MNKHTLRIYLILLFGLLTPILMMVFPVSIGGNSLVFVVSVPLLIVLSVTFSFLYYYLNKRIIKETNKTVAFYMFIGILTVLSFISYPYKQY